LLRKVAELAQETALPVWTHLSQSTAENEVVGRRSGCTPTELLQRVGLLNPSLIAAHAIHVSDDDIQRVAAAGATIAHIPKGNATGGFIAPTVKMKEAGVKLALATDNLTQDMVEAMRWCLALARVQVGGVSASWQPRNVFEMATQAGANALGKGDKIGLLRPGYLADIVVFEFRRPHLRPLLNPLGTLVHDGCGRDVEHVFVDGCHVIANGRSTTVDVERVLADAQRAAEKLSRQVALAA
jgi:5-methylthioadenosine/S-adenosylhomocysteine deaminase